MKNVVIGTSFAAIALVSMFVGSMPAHGTDRIARPYDWTLELKTKQLQHEFEYSGSHLHGVDKVKITYEHVADTAHPEPHPTDYESLWFHNGKPLGMERFNKFDVTPGDATSILISHQGATASSDECKAAADAVLRIIVDANLNHNAVVNVRIPNDCYEQVKQALLDKGCEEESSVSESGRATAINIFLQTDPDPTVTSIIYYI